MQLTPNRIWRSYWQCTSDDRRIWSSSKSTKFTKGHSMTLLTKSIAHKHTHQHSPLFDSPCFCVSFALSPLRGHHTQTHTHLMVEDFHPPRLPIETDWKSIQKSAESLHWFDICVFADCHIANNVLMVCFTLIHFDHTSLLTLEQIKTGMTRTR